MHPFSPQQLPPVRIYWSPVIVGISATFTEQPPVAFELSLYGRHSGWYRNRKRLGQREMKNSRGLFIEEMVCGVPRL